MSSKRHGRKKRSLRFSRRTPPGAIPGTVVADQTAPRPVIHVIAYGPETFEEKQVEDPAHLAEIVGRHAVTWVNVDGLGDAATIETIGKVFGLHPLSLEDVVNVHQRAKLEDYGEYLFIVARMLQPAERLETDQTSIFLGKNFVVTFQELPGDCLDPVRERLRKAKGRIRQAGADFLAYALLDAIVDAYFPVLERYGEQLDRLDSEITTRVPRSAVNEIHTLRGELLLLRRVVWPLRDAVGALARDPNRLISDTTRIYLRDCYDHTVQIIDLLETCREMCSDLREFYLSTVNNQMSEIMKVLTVIATIFIPMSFVAGVYGMNFDTQASAWNMPELHWRFGYPWALGVMAGVAAVQLFYFWRRGWLSR